MRKRIFFVIFSTLLLGLTTVEGRVDDTPINRKVAPSPRRLDLPVEKEKDEFERFGEVDPFFERQQRAQSVTAPPARPSRSRAPASTLVDPRSLPVGTASASPNSAPTGAIYSAPTSSPAKSPGGVTNSPATAPAPMIVPTSNPPAKPGGSVPKGGGSSMVPGHPAYTPAGSAAAGGASNTPAASPNSGFPSNAAGQQKQQQPQAQQQQQAGQGQGQQPQQQAGGQQQPQQQQAQNSQQLHQRSHQPKCEEWQPLESNPLVRINDSYGGAVMLSGTREIRSPASGMIKKSQYVDGGCRVTIQHHSCPPDSGAGEEGQEKQTCVTELEYPARLCPPAKKELKACEVLAGGQQSPRTQPTGRIQVVTKNGEHPVTRRWAISESQKKYYRGAARIPASGAQR